MKTPSIPPATSQVQLVRLRHKMLEAIAHSVEELAYNDPLGDTAALIKIARKLHHIADARA